ncbi:Arm DNA-binding domain-containing protein [Xanthobacter versatilis]|uniref:Arm DNA-binding domain-containing protein n=1 Tax=Xanthobacter autotrophicus (strain ATCC BAA-1158 / Py2) TaxID=78245 RepID=UPI0037274A73
MPLTDMQIRKAKAAEKPYKLTDGGGLHLAISPAGGKVWRLRYEIAGKEKLLTIGPTRTSAFRKPVRPAWPRRSCFARAKIHLQRKRIAGVLPPPRPM